MSGETESEEFLAREMVESLIKDWVTNAATIAHSGHSDGSEREQGFHEGVKQMRWLHLAEPWLIAKQITDALKLAGWEAPQGQVPVTYRGPAND